MSTLNVDKVDPNTGTALEIGTSGDTITVPSGATFVVAGTTEITGTNNVQRPNAQPIIINGSMDVSQRSTSATGKTASGLYAVDRMTLGIDNLGTWTVAQESLTSGDAFDNGFSRAFRLDCTTADASPAASDSFFVQYKLEGNSVQSFKKGTSNAEKFTLSFYVKSNKTGTAQVSLIDGDNSRMVGATYTIASTDTWEQQVLNFPADTTGAFGNDNAKSLELEFALDAGSDFTSGTVPSAWETSANVDRSVNDLALGDSTSNDWAITGIQLEVGEYTSSTIPPFQHESYGNNLQRCQRYYFKESTDTNDTLLGSSAYYQSTTRIHIPFVFPVTMRAAPTLVYASGTGYYQMVANGTADGFDDLTINDTANIHGVVLYNSTQVSGTAGHGGSVRNQYNGSSTYGSVAFSSEL
jgi:hypothetical protein